MKIMLAILCRRPRASNTHLTQISVNFIGIYLSYWVIGI